MEVVYVLQVSYAYKSLFWLKIRAEFTMLESLKEAVLLANCELVESGLVLGTWGNASAIERSRGLVVIKPSGVPYDDLTPSDMVVVALETGDVVEGELRPSSDTPTHLVLYRHFADIGGIVHTHSHFATCWAQAGRGIPCFGTTHADYFYGEVPVTAPMPADAVSDAYEHQTGIMIVKRFEGLEPLQIPGVLVAQHGPFTWGSTVEHAVENAVVLEEVAQLALNTLSLRNAQKPIPDYLLDKHFFRKHGKSAYYGQS